MNKDGTRITRDTLKEIVESLGCVSHGVDMYLDIRTGDVIPVTEMEMDSLKQDVDDMPDWQKDISVQVKTILENKDGRFLKLPDSFEIHEWELMRDFCKEIDDRSTFTQLERAIHGSGAFGSFKDSLRRLNLEEQWHKFRFDKLQELAISWCEENDISISD